MWVIDYRKSAVKVKSGCGAPSRKEIAMKENKMAEIFEENGITYRLVENGFGEKYAKLSGIW